jgi:hypothetical protein
MKGADPRDPEISNTATSAAAMVAAAPTAARR